jgi:hypothetical protein
MSWMVLAPGFLLGALAIALPVILHFLRKQPTEVNTFPTLVFLAKSLRKKARFNSIRRWLVLLARCAIFGLLALAFARPFFAQPIVSSSTALMIILDNSYSMGAGGQFEKSKADAIQAVQDLGPGDLAGLILANSHPRLEVPLGQDKDAVLQALKTAELSFSANDYDSALRLADAQVTASPCGTKLIDLFGDNQDLAWQAVDFKRPLTPGVQLKIAPSAPRDLEDVAIDDVKVAAPFTAANQKMSAEVKIHNLSATAAQTRKLHLELEGKEVATADVSLRPGEIADLNLEFTAGPLQPTHGLAKLEADAFPINDTRYFVLNPVSPLRVGVWPPGPAGEVDLLSVALAPSPELATLSPAAITSAADLGKCDVLVLRPGDVSDPTLAAAIVDAIQKGKPALVFVDGSHASQLWLQDLGLASGPRHSSDDPLHLGAIDFNRPEVAIFAKPGNGDLFDIRFTNPPDLQLPDSAKIIASFDDGTPALAEAASGQGALLLVATGLDRASTTWPLQSTFLPFVQESLKHLVGRDVPVSQVLVGEALPGEHPGVNSDTPGIVPTTQGGVLQFVAVNIDPAESDLTTWTNQLDLDRLTSSKTPPPAVSFLAALQGEEVERHQRFWWYAILATTGFLFLEIFLANRTPL